MKFAFVACAVLLAICAHKWLQADLAMKMLLWYLIEKDIPLPSFSEVERGKRFVVEHTIDDFFGGGPHV